MAYLSRADLDNFAERILCDFVKAEYRGTALTVGS